ncbi:MAG: diguanylate cyclase [Oscillospiraceae bacterium]|nr:diguanylate cyclase [Oscillospiraceae bacterium]
MKKKILIVDGEKKIQDSLRDMLSERYDVSCASTGEEAVELYDRERPDLVLTDLNIPHMSGFDLQRILREKRRELVPMMFMSAGASEETEIRGLEGGAFDYIRKPVKADTLLWRVGNIMRHMERIHTLQRAADTDPMTGLFHKAYARRVLTDLCLRADGMLMMIDLDNFKLVNDLYGHTMGDRILIRFAEILRGVIRSTDIAGRMGGDEFLIFCQDIHEESTVAEKTALINQLLSASAKEYMGADMRIPLGASVGAVPVPEEGTDFADL